MASAPSGLIVRFCVECGASCDVSDHQTKPVVCDDCKVPRWNRLRRERYRGWTVETRARWNRKRRERYARPRLP